MDDMSSLVSSEERDELLKIYGDPTLSDHIIYRLLLTHREQKAENDLIRAGIQEAYELGRADREKEILDLIPQVDSDIVDNGQCLHGAWSWEGCEICFATALTVAIEKSGKKS